MILYSSQVSLSILLASTLVLASIYFHYYKKNFQIALLLLIISGLVLRLFMASVDPFLHDWDERFHALVAKNIMNYPFQPMLRVNPIMPFKIEDWCCNHIWVHKQPLFLWQMALSMKIFGINEIAIRIPSALMGSISIFFIYDIAKNWIKNINASYLAALLFAVSYYQLELTSGRFPLDQNDVAFSFYVTASIWAFVRYLNSNDRIKWSIIIGLFVGCAVLNKWLTGILIFGGWGLYELLQYKEQFNIRRLKPLIISIIVSLLVFLPWQIYILQNFPIESNLMYLHNKRHIFEVLGGHHGTIWFHFNQMRTMYGQLLLIFIPLGVFTILSDKQVDKKLSISLFVMVLVIYSFFSFIVQTKMPAFAFPVNSIIWIVIASGVILCYKLLMKSFNTVLWSFCIVLLAIYTLKPWQISNYRLKDNQVRNAKIENTQVYKSLDLTGELKDRVIINCKSFEDVELMFYQNVNAYHWYPDEPTMDSLLNKGYKFAAFKNHNNQNLPKYIYDNEEIIIIDEDIK